MVNVFRSEVQEGLLRLGELSFEFWNRALLLYVTGAESWGMRFQRLQCHIREKALADIFNPTDREFGSNLNNSTPEQFVSECSDAYIEEVRNSEQVALITYEEMWAWLNSFVEEWRKLADSTLK